MGELILCTQSIAANPFFLEDTSLNIYSMEEMSYYIYNNVYLLNSDFISVDLCNWMGRELGLRQLQQQLLNAKKENAPLHVLVGMLLSQVGYLSKSEIRQVVETIASFENKSSVECQKMRGDRLMEKDKIVDAIFEYEHLLDDNPAGKMPREFEGDIWHNLGSAYARLFFFDEAAKCFEQAYMRNHKAVSMRMMLASLRCNKNEAAFDELVAKYFIPADEVASIKEEVTALSKQAEIADFGQQIDTLLQNHEVFDKTTSEMLGKWKQEYNLLCRI